MTPRLRMPSAQRCSVRRSARYSARQEETWAPALRSALAQGCSAEALPPRTRGATRRTPCNEATTAPTCNACMRADTRCRCASPLRPYRELTLHRRGPAIRRPVRRHQDPIRRHRSRPRRATRHRAPSLRLRAFPHPVHLLQGDSNRQLTPRRLFAVAGAAVGTRGSTNEKRLPGEARRRLGRRQGSP